jgi:glutamate-1-semialdehyde 2,1-aminomutase
MELVAPAGPVYQAGTLSGNPLAMAAGIATLKELRRPGQYDELERRASLLADGLAHVLQRAQVPAQLVRIGSLFTIFFTTRPVANFADARTSDTRRFTHFFWNMLHQGIYLPPSQFETCFVSLALSESMLEETVQAARAALNV